MTQSKPKQLSTSQLTPIEDVATAWGVTAPTVKNWVEFVYQAWEILLPSNGPFPEWGVQLLTITAKHVSEKASLYFAETGEKRRLKGTDFVRKIRALRAEGHFQEFQQFQKFQNFQNFQADESAEALEDEALGELGSVSRRSDTDLSRIKQTIEQREDAEIEDLANFIEDSDRRKMAKLVRRLKTGKSSGDSIGQAIDVAFKRLPG